MENNPKNQSCLSYRTECGTLPMPFPHSIPTSFMARLPAVLIRHPCATLLISQKLSLAACCKNIFLLAKRHPCLCCMSHYCHSSTTPHLWDTNIIANCHTSRRQVLWEHLNTRNELWQTRGTCVKRGNSTEGSSTLTTQIPYPTGHTDLQAFPKMDFP